MEVGKANMVRLARFARFLVGAEIADVLLLLGMGEKLEDGRVDEQEEVERGRFGETAGGADKRDQSRERG